MIAETFLEHLKEIHKKDIYHWNQDAAELLTATLSHSSSCQWEPLGDSNFPVTFVENQEATANKCDGMNDVKGLRVEDSGAGIAEMPEPIDNKWDVVTPRIVEGEKVVEGDKVVFF